MEASKSTVQFEHIILKLRPCVYSLILLEVCFFITLVLRPGKMPSTKSSHTCPVVLSVFGSIHLSWVKSFVRNTTLSFDLPHHPNFINAYPHLINLYEVRNSSLWIIYSTVMPLIVLLALSVVVSRSSSSTSLIISEYSSKLPATPSDLSVALVIYSVTGVCALVWTWLAGYRKLFNSCISVVEDLLVLFICDWSNMVVSLAGVMSLSIETEN